MGVEIPGIVKPADLLASLYPDVRWFQQQYYVNQYPLLTRLQRAPVGSPRFAVRHSKFRPRQYPITVALNATDTYSVLTIPTVATPGASPGFGDVTSLEAGDVIAYGAERVEVIATPYIDPGAMPVIPPGQTKPIPGTILVRRGVEGTTVAIQATSVVGQLIGNSRDGGEVNQTGITARPFEQLQNVQNWQMPVQVSGAVESSSGAYGLQGGSQFALTKMQQFENMMRDMERSSIYGIGEAPGFYADGTAIRPKQIGLKNQVVTNKKAATTGSAYTPYAFIQDALTPLWTNGSAPDIMLCGAAFLAGLTAWSKSMQRIDVGQTTLGVQIKAFETNLAPGLAVVPCLSMDPGEVFVGMSSLMYWRVKQGEQFWPRGTRGYAYEGDWVAEGAIEIRDEEKHAFITGITGYTP